MRVWASVLVSLLTVSCAASHEEGECIGDLPVVSDPQYFDGSWRYTVAIESSALDTRPTSAWTPVVAARDVYFVDNWKLDGWGTLEAYDWAGACRDYDPPALSVPSVAISVAGLESMAANANHCTPPGARHDFTEGHVLRLDWWSATWDLRGLLVRELGIEALAPMNATLPWDDADRMARLASVVEDHRFEVSTPVAIRTEFGYEEVFLRRVFEREPRPGPSRWCD